MPISSYYKGEGERVMRDMKKRYGKRAERVFYSTAAKRKMTPPRKRRRSAGRK